MASGSHSLVRASADELRNSEGFDHESLNAENISLADAEAGALNFQPTLADCEAQRNDDLDCDDAASETSTVVHDHESFETFQHKVYDLAAQIFPNASSFRVERMKGGTYNQVVGLTVGARATKKLTPRWFRAQVQQFFQKYNSVSSADYIIRIPRDGGASLEKDIAILNAVGAQLCLPVPRVVKYDASINNPLGKPYMVLTRLRGENLSQVEERLNLEQWKCIVRQVTQLITEIAGCTSECGGEISTETLFTAPTTELALEKFHVPRDSGIFSEFSKPHTWPAMPQDPLALMLEQCERWREFQHTQTFCWENIWDGFATISNSLHRRGFLDGPFALAHGDLQGYNLLVDIKDSSTVEITGVLDWDFAMLAPKFMAYRAPFWLWRNEDIDSDDSDAEENVNHEPCTELECELKYEFQATVSGEFKKFAFAPEAILARRMFDILKDGIFSSYAIQEAEGILREWNQLHPEDEVVGDESDGESFILGTGEESEDEEE